MLIYHSKNVEKYHSFKLRTGGHQGENPGEPTEAMRLQNRNQKKTVINVT